MSLSPADDILIWVEKALNVDSDVQLVVSILSKKVVAGSTHMLIDVSVGSTTKVRSIENLERLEMLLKRVAQAFRVWVLMVHTNGAQLVGRGIGPTPKARDVLTVFQRAPIASFDLRERSLLLAGALLESYGTAVAGAELAMATDLLDSGTAWWRFEAICKAQGGLCVPGGAVFRRDVVAKQNDTITHIDNRHLARITKLADVPMYQVVSVQMYVRLRDQVSVGQPPFTIHVQTLGELEYSSAYALTHAVTRLSPIGVG